MIYDRQMHYNITGVLTLSILKQNDEIKYKVTKLVMCPDIIIDGVYQVNWVGCMILFNYSLF